MKLDQIDFWTEKEKDKQPHYPRAEGRRLPMACLRLVE